MSFIKELKKIFDKKTYFKAKISMLKKYRDNLANCKYKKVFLVCNENEIENALKTLKTNYNFEIEKILVYTYNNNFKPYKYGNYIVDKIQTKKYKKKHNLAVFLGNTSTATSKWTFVPVINYVDNRNTYKYYIFSTNPEKIVHFEKKPNKNFIKQHYKAISMAYSLLQDKESKDIFLRTINCIHYGNSFCEKNSYYEQYFHPIIHAKQNDYVISAGLGPYLYDTKSLSIAVGNNGKIFAFEPEQHNVEICKNLLEKEKDMNNVEICDYGIWKCKDILKISNQQGSSRIVHNNTTVEYTECRLISIDEFVEENNIDKVDFIKLDIEGAEPEALEGAIETITKYRPRLALSIYHNPEHCYSLLLYLNSLNLGYKFYMGHHRTFLYETVLYAISS